MNRNHLTQGDDDYSAIPQSLRNKKIEDIILQITKPGSILKTTECVAVIHDFFKAIAENLENGYGFVSEYIRIQPTISGVFQGKDDQFDPQRHEKQVSINASQYLKDAVKGLQLEKVSSIKKQAEIESVFDLKSKTSDILLTAGHTIRIDGQRLKFDPEANDEGIYIVPTSGGKERKLHDLFTNKPSTLSAMLPDDLAAGKYQIEVRNRQRGNKNLFVGVHAKVLKVK